MAYCYALGIPNFSYAIMHPKGVSTMQFERNEQHYEWLRNKVSALCRLLETQTGPYPLGDNGWWCSEKWCENSMLFFGTVKMLQTELSLKD